MKMVSINEGVWVNPEHVLGVYQDKSIAGVNVVMDDNIEWISAYDLEATINLLETGTV